MKNIIILLTMIIFLGTTHQTYTEEISENSQSEIEKILNLDLGSFLEYDVPCPDDLKDSIQEMIGENSNSDIKEKIVETLNSTEMEDISIDNIKALLLNYTESFDVLGTQTKDTDNTK